MNWMISAIKAVAGSSPGWCWGMVLAVLLVLVGEWHGRHTVHADWAAEREKQAELAREVGRARGAAVKDVEVRYVNRIKTVYLKGEIIEKQVPIFVTPTDDQLFVVNAGFVRIFNAAWAGADPGPAGDADRQSSGISLSTVAREMVFNATACRTWREIALGTREAYQAVQHVAHESSSAASK